MTASCWIGVGCVALFFVLSLMGVKVAYSLLGAGILGLILINGLQGAFTVVGSALFSMISTFDYAVLPMFVLMAATITMTGLGSELYASCRTWLGHMHGGLAIATIIASRFSRRSRRFPGRRSWRWAHWLCPRCSAISTATGCPSARWRPAPNWAT